ncbi:hypothetical protein TrLO_g10411 [Triparma laevis f. longispina]|uniref:Uncharacterized protein n=1 Tax=Triparma laevis f. longispina TaxID=1714387 RepID=A0A9W7FN10_9STRA|nr:hypothetical protein TrLO_g10411 [Triparma laevis f. longispina]
MMSIIMFLVIVKRTVLPGKRILAEFDDERLKQVILKGNPKFLCSVLSAMMFVISQAVFCLGEHRLEPEMCVPFVQNCCVALWFGCAAFAAHVLILPFKTTSYEITDFMRFNVSFHEQCQALVDIWSVIVVLFVFASGLALDEKLASFWMFTPTIEACGLTVRGSLFVLTILMMIIGLSLTSLRNDYYEALIWHDESVFFVSAGYILGCLFAATRPKSNSWWQKNFPNVAPVNFLVLGIYAVWSGNRFWGSGEIVWAYITFLIAEVFSCYTTELQRGFCY